VFPNPTSDLIFIDDRIRSATLITTDGRAVMDYDHRDRTPMNVMHAKPGIYLLQLRSGRVSKTVRIVKK
jgi:hypothetical protein